VKGNAKYGVFLSHAINGHSCVEIGRDNVPSSVNHLIVEYARYAKFLYQRRKEVIYHFSRMESLDIHSAQGFFNKFEQRCERQPEIPTTKVASYPDTEVYEQFARCAERYGAFRHTNAALLMDFRDGNLAIPLVTDNLSRTTFFLKMMEHYHLIGRIRWKRLEESGAIIRGDGKPIVEGYMRRVASKLYIEERLEAVNPHPRYVADRDLYDRIASDIRRIMGRL